MRGGWEDVEALLLLLLLLLLLPGAPLAPSSRGMALSISSASASDTVVRISLRDSGE